MALTVSILNESKYREGRFWTKLVRLTLDNAYAKGGYSLNAAIGTSPVAVQIDSVSQPFDVEWVGSSNKMRVYTRPRSVQTNVLGTSINASAVTANVALFGPFDASASVVEFGVVHLSSSSATIGTVARIQLNTLTTANVLTAKATATMKVSKKRGNIYKATFTKFTVAPSNSLLIRKSRQGKGAAKAGTGTPYVKWKYTRAGAEASANATMSSVQITLTVKAKQS